MNLFRTITLSGILLSGILLVGIGTAGCDHLSNPNLLSKSSDNTDEFQCTLSVPDKDGIIKSTGYKYTVRCEAKQGRVRFINLRASVVATEKGANNRTQSRSIGERMIRNGGVVVTPERPFEYTGSLRVSSVGSWSGRRSLHVSATIDYPDDPELEYEAEEQDKINRPWRYKLLVVERL
ncbi:MAG: hypothetical protein NXI24_15945 [bacterium]|nr:hypothetical protein [bacterium]